MEEFEGFRSRQELEQYTGVPNEVFDKIMSELNGSEFKILCAIFRKTYGWVEGADKNGNAVYKIEDNIAQSQLMDMVGASRNTIKRNLQNLIDKNLIVKVEEHESGVNKPAKYRIKQRVSKVDSRNGKRVSKSDSRGGSKIDSPRLSKFDSTKERSNKENKNNIYRLWEKILNTPIPNWQELGSYEDDFSLAVIEEALERTKEHCDNQKWYYKYFKGILNNWLNESVESIEDVDELDKQHEDKKNGKTNINPGGGLTAEEIVKEHGLEEEVRV